MKNRNMLFGAGILLVPLLSALVAAFLHSAKVQAFTFVFFSALAAGLATMLLARKQHSRHLERLSRTVARLAAGNVTGVPGESDYPGEYRDLIKELNSVSLLMRSVAENSQATLADRLMEVLNNVAQKPGIASLVEAEHRRTLSDMLKQVPELEAVYSNRADGTFIFSEPPARLANARARDWWQRAMAGDNYLFEFLG
jgi:methyl-accepting chemotaxis protein